MLNVSHVQRIFLARAVADMRKGINGLSALVTDRLGKDPLSGDLFVFVNRHRTLMKMLMWEVSGFWLATKRLERGTFAVRGRVGSAQAEGCHVLSVAEIMNIVEGIDVHQAVYHQHYCPVREPAASHEGQPASEN
ncbi:MAG TPA: IS66 family insertion sequence element accessory protein TnpB [Woeseiaceae bacterium]